MKNTPLAVNKLEVIDNFRYIEKIGEGGCGLVFKAEQISTGKFVAIKTVKICAGTTEHKKKQQLARFERETQLCSEIYHPNIVQLLDKGCSDRGEPYAVFEFVHGETLNSYILRNKHLSAPVMANIMGQVLDGLVCAHNKGIVHRDLKPHNIMVSKWGSKNHVKILDFGIGAFTQDFRSIDYQDLTVAQDVLGTPTYSAPEQLRGEPSTVKSDLYSWGLIVIECLTGKPVMGGVSIAEVFQKQLMASSVPLPPSIVGHPLASLLRRVLEKNSRNRAENAQTVFEEFEQINFNTLIGDIDGQKNVIADYQEYTVADEMVWSGVTAARKQMTILCLKLNLVVSRGTHLDLETLDTIQKDQLNLCKDIAIRYGGYVSETFMNNLAVYFGYPESSDTDARRAGRTALEIVTAVKKRNALLMEQQGISIDIRVGLHTGTVLVQRNNLPEGSVPNMAFDLVYMATSGSVLVSAPAKKLLEPYLEFESVDEIQFSNGRETIETYQLVGERQTEALSSLRPWSADKKMIGRDGEKNSILQLWQNSMESDSSVLISGQAGIGKSKLVYEVKKEIRSVGGRVCECRCFPEHQNNALYPFLHMLRNHCGISGIEDKDIAISRLKVVLEKTGCSVDETLPLLCSWLSIPIPEECAVRLASPEKQKQLLFQTLKQCLLFLDNEKSFLLVVEDLHWLDQTSADFIEYILSDTNEGHYLLLMTTRPEFVNPWNLDCLSQINIEILSEDSVKLLVEGSLDGKSISKKALLYIFERADGIPLYVEELTRMLVDQNYVVLDNEGYDLVEDIDTKLIPSTLQDLLNARLDRLSLAKETAQLAAVIGREFSYELLIKASTKDEATVQSDLNLLLNSDLVYRQRRVKGENYIFRHALIRDAAYDGMVSTNRKEVHRNIAETLEKNCNIQKEISLQIIAFHYEQATDFEKSQKYWFDSALVSRQKTGAYLDTVFYLSKALNYVESIQNENKKVESKIRIYNLLGETQLYTSGFTSSDVEENNEKAFQLAYENDISPELKFEVLNNRCFNKINRADINGAFGIVEKLSTTSHENVSVANLIIARTNDCYVKYLRAEFKGVVETCKSTYELSQKTKGAEGELFAPNSLAIIKCFEFISNVCLGNIELAEKQISEVLRESIDLGYDDMLAGTHWQIASAYLIKASYFGDANEDLNIADQHLSKAIDIATENELGFIVIGCKLMKECLALLQGTAESEELFFELFNQSGLVAFKEWYFLFVIKFLYDKKEYSKALDHINEGLEACMLNGINFPVLYYHCFKGMILFELGNEDYEHCFVDSIAFSKKNDIKWGELFCIYQYVRCMTSKERQNDNLYLVEELITSFPNSGSYAVTESKNWKNIVSFRKIINQ
ncbi:TOMM system kinase/cyclase fusion protein [Flavobacterium sp. ZT3R18]|uniref:TOMM system kinase/cyclase fusion protein n=1 Tax=Flavobacterium sp. ZT3R18 TaxID=2594429 RepID=UPI00117AFC83|nr:TOMM system kinase/cyclase fusion protein [Flavobacterium sp. ZT3R18]TRX35031.1 TOMM system kinase/cyclase fusion protein [Flavobacterium sp. ZT3R18]